MGTFLAVQRLGCCTFTAGGMGSIPGQGTKILHAAWRGKINKNNLCRLHYTCVGQGSREPEFSVFTSAKHFDSKVVDCGDCTT